jgi:type I restriction enzyme S subunit
MLCTWGDLISLEYGKPIFDKGCAKGAVPVFGTNGQIGTSNLKPLCPHASFILGRKGAYRGVHYSSIPFSVIDTAFYAVSKSKELDLKWAYYKFLTYDINRMDSGSAIPSTDRYEIYSITIDLPSLQEQTKTVAILEAFDYKIAHNRAINHRLEQMAQAIFKSCFLNFELFGGAMPKDWKTGNLTDIADYLNGLAMQRFRPKGNEKYLPVLKIKELRQGFCDKSSELCSSSISPNYIVHDGDVIFSWSGSLLVDFWCGGDCGLNQHLFKVTSSRFHKWFFYSWTRHYLNKFVALAEDKATTMGHIKREALENAKVLIPNKKDYETVKELLSPIYAKIITNRLENRSLVEIREFLLPQLMSGELSVADV